MGDSRQMNMVDALSKAIKEFPVAVKQIDVKVLLSFLVFSVILSCPTCDRNKGGYQTLIIGLVIFWTDLLHVLSMQTDEFASSSGNDEMVLWSACFGSSAHPNIARWAN